VAGYDDLRLGTATAYASTDIYVQIFLSHENNADLCGVEVTEESTSTAIVTASTGANQASPPMRGPNTVGLGVGLGIPLLLTCIALGFYVGRKGTNTPPATEPPVVAPPSPGSPGLRRWEKTGVPVGGPGGAGPRQEMDNDRGLHEADPSPPGYTHYGPGQASRGVGSEHLITAIPRGELPT